MIIVSMFFSGFLFLVFTIVTMIVSAFFSRLFDGFVCTTELLLFASLFLFFSPFYGFYFCLILCVYLLLNVSRSKSNCLEECMCNCFLTTLIRCRIRINKTIKSPSSFCFVMRYRGRCFRFTYKKYKRTRQFKLTITGHVNRAHVFAVSAEI